MKLLVNVDCLHAPLTGIGHYARNLLSELTASADISDVQAIRASGWASAEELAQMLAPVASKEVPGIVPEIVPEIEPSRVPNRSFKQITLNGLREVAKRVPYARNVKRHIQNRLAMAREAELAGYIYWEPNYNLLPISNTAVTTVHDLSHIHYPEFHPKERVELLNAHLANSIARAKKVVTVSEFTRAEVARNFGIPEAQLTVVSPAASSEFRPYSDEECRAVRLHYQLPEQFILSVGTLEPRKNLLGLIAAYSQLPADYRNHFPLVLVGGKGWHTGAISDAIAKLPSQQIRRLGYVPQSDLPKLLSAASVMAYPSFYEGFGMPLLESMAAGTPVLTSNCSSMPEVSGGASVLIEPTQVDSITQGLLDLLGSESLQQSCRGKGLQNVQRYSWASSAQTLLKVLHDCEQSRHET